MKTCVHDRIPETLGKDLEHGWHSGSKDASTLDSTWPKAYSSPGRGYEMVLHQLQTWQVLGSDCSTLSLGSPQKIMR
jgi:hypothetical protein